MENDKNLFAGTNDNPSEETNTPSPNPKNRRKKDPKKRKLTFSRLFNNNRFVMAFSVFCAVVLWTIISATTHIEKEMTISGVPVDYSATLSESATKDLGLQIVGNKVERVNVKISGNAFIVGQITADDILVTAKLTNVTTAGTYSVNLVAQPKNNKNFNIDWIEPSIVQLKLDRTVEKEFPVELKTNAYEVQDGFTASESLSLQNITVTGPEENVKRVSKVVAETDQVDSTLSQTNTYMAKIVLYDDMDMPIEDPELTLSATEAEVTVVVKEVRSLPVKVNYVNLPSGFSTRLITLSPATIRVAAPSDVFETLTEIVVGSIDFSQVDTSHKTFTYPIDLPSGCTNQSGEDEVTVKVNLSGMRTRELDVSQISLSSEREGQAINVITRTVTVRVTGPAEEIELLTSDDITAIIPLDEVPETAGKHEVPLSIQISGGGECWVYGKPTAFVSVS